MNCREEVFIPGSHEQGLRDVVHEVEIFNAMGVLSTPFLDNFIPRNSGTNKINKCFQTL